MKKIISVLLLAVLALGLLSGCGGDSAADGADEAAAEADAAEAAAPDAAVPGGDVAWEDYQAWLVSIVPSITPTDDIANAIIEEINALSGWDDLDTAVDPWAKFFSDDAYNASTWDEFVAAGGAGTYDEAYVDEAADGASGEPTGEASGEISE